MDISGTEHSTEHGKHLVSEPEHCKQTVPTYLGIEIPEAVRKQIEMTTGMSLSQIDPHVIAEAVRGFEGDADIIEHHEDDDLLGKMHLTWGERVRADDDKHVHEHSEWAGYGYWPQHADSQAKDAHPDDGITGEIPTAGDTRKPTLSFVERLLHGEQITLHLGV